MPTVYTFSRSDAEYKADLVRVFAAREQWTMQAELLVEPVGWDALWKLSKDFCRKFEVRFPCIAYIAVTSVDFENLSACVDVLSVQHESVTLPEVVEDVPLVELWPTEKQREACVDAAVTAEFIDLLRFYYTNIWMPWDDQDDKVVLPATIEERMQLWNELHNGTIPSAEARNIQLLRNSAIDAHNRLKELDSSLCEVNGADEDDSLLPASYIASCAEQSARLDGLAAQWTLYETALIREHHLARVKLRAPADGGGSLVAALWRGGDVFAFEQLSAYLRARLRPEQTLRVLCDAERALAARPAELLLCSEQWQLPEVPLANVDVLSFNGATLTASSLRSCLLQASERVRLRDVSLSCRDVNTTLLARAGELSVANCLLFDESSSTQSDFAQGLVAQAGARVLLTDCTFDNFYSGIVVHKGAQVELRNCLIKNCGVGIQMYGGATVALSNTTVSDCAEQSVRCELAPAAALAGATGVEGLTIDSSCKIGSGDLQKEVLLVRQDVDL